ncbi:hypothetical protein ES703_92367 [subsurface metagenome]
MNNSKNNNDRKQKSILASFYKSFKTFVTSSPILLGVILLLGLFRTNVSPQLISSIFKGELLRDTIIGSLIGSISAGNPIISYIIGAELLSEGVSLFAVTAFIVAWVTVGVIQFPAEAAILGKRFAFTRNLISFILAILVSIVIVTTLMIIQ